MSKRVEIIKILLYRIHLFNLFSKLRHKTYPLLKEGYHPKRFWNGWSDNYSKERAQLYIDKSHEWLLKKVGELKPKNVLEIGCGFGKNLKFLSENLSYPTTLMGFDISESMVRKAKNNLNNQVILGCADINSLPFHDQSYDLIFTYAALMHVPEQNIRRAIQELRRVAKKYLIIIEETYWSIGNPQGSTFKPNEYTFIYDYSKILPDCGLIIEEMRVEKGVWNLICLLCKKEEKDKIS